MDDDVTNFARDKNANRLVTGDTVKWSVSTFTSTGRAAGLIEFVGIINAIRPASRSFTTPGDNILYIRVLSQKPYTIAVYPDDMIKISEEEYNEFVILLKLTGQ